jgi:hypothetical protein
MGQRGGRRGSERSGQGLVSGQHWAYAPFHLSAAKLLVQACVCCQLSSARGSINQSSALV